MLQENKRIYAIMVCFIGGVKQAVEAIVFDEYKNTILYREFFYERCGVIAFNIMAIFALLSIVRTEVSELARIKKNFTDLNKHA